MAQEQKTTNQGSNSLAKAKGTLPAIDDAAMEADARGGFEEVHGRDDLAIPFIVPLSHSSPETIKNKAEHIEGAKAGMILNKVTKELYEGEEGISVIPVYFQKQFVEWADRGTGSKAPVNIHPATSDVLTKATRDKDGKFRLENGNYIEDTRNHFVVLVKKDGSAETAIVSMKGSQLKKSRRWNTMAMGQKLKGSNGHYTAPLWAFQYQLTTVGESNDKGNWTGWEIAIGKKTQDPSLYAQAKAFYSAVSKGEIKAQPVVEGDKSSAKTTDKNDEEIPF